MNRKSVKVVAESSSGRNTKFLDTKTRRIMSSPQFVKAIENGVYEGYHVRKINGVKTPCSNPDDSTKDNLG